MERSGLDKVIKTARVGLAAITLSAASCAFTATSRVIEVEGYGKVRMDWDPGKVYYTQPPFYLELEDGTRIKYSKQSGLPDRLGELEKGDRVEVTKPGQKPVTFTAPNVPKKYVELYQLELETIPWESY